MTQLPRNSLPVDWPQIRAQVAARQAKRRAARPNFKIIPLAELVRHSRLPLFQTLEARGLLDGGALDDNDRIILFISHRWQDHLVPEDGTLIEQIFEFCLNVVLKNNFPGFPCTQEVHHSRTLSQKLSSLIQSLSATDVLASRATFGRFDGMISSVSSDSATRRLISEILSRFYLWIDFCCLPQEHLSNGVRIQRTSAEDQIFLAGLDGMDTLLEKVETVIFWRASEFTRAWLFYESLMSLPRGRASFMMPMDLIAALSSIVRHWHANFSQLGLLNSLYTVDTFQKIGITATSHRDLVELVFLMNSSLLACPWRFRVVQ